MMTSSVCPHARWRTMTTPKKRKVAGWYCDKRKAFIDMRMCAVCKHRPNIEPPTAADNSNLGGR